MVYEPESGENQDNKTELVCCNKCNKRQLNDQAAVSHANLDETLVQNRICCEACSKRNSQEFHKVVELKDSGLLIYKYRPEEATKVQDKIYPNYEKKQFVVLENTRGNPIQRYDFIKELCQYRTNCLRCKNIANKLQNLLQNINTIKKNEIVGVCEYCHRFNERGNCKRCEKVVGEFLDNRIQTERKRIEGLQDLVDNLLSFLDSMFSKGQICEHLLQKCIYQRNELQKVFQQLDLQRFIKNRREVEISNAIENIQKENVFEDKKRIDNLRDNLNLIHSKVKELEDNFQFNQNFAGYPVKRVHAQTNVLGNKLSSPDVQTKITMDRDKQYDVNNKALDKKKQYIIKDKTTYREKQNIKHEQQITPVKKAVAQTDLRIKLALQHKKQKFIDEKNAKQAVSDSMITKMLAIAENLAPPIADNTIKKTYEYTVYAKPKLVKKLIASIPEHRKDQKDKQTIIEDVQIFDLEAEPLTNSMKSIESKKLEIQDISLDLKDTPDVKCLDKIVNFSPKFIQGDQVIAGKYDEMKKERKNYQNMVALAKLKYVTKDIRRNESDEKIYQSLPKVEDSCAFQYQLSNPYFITNGWTQLPTTLITKKVDIYDMKPTGTKLNWFVKNKNKDVILYDSGEKYAEVDVNGNGKIYYKNGNLAMIYNNSIDNDDDFRCKIFSAGESKPPNVLAIFDFFGNGIVYDEKGRMRLKYNQHEGVIVDKNIGRPRRWQWYDTDKKIAPKLRTTYQEQYENPNPEIIQRKCDPRVAIIEQTNALKEIQVKFGKCSFKSLYLKFLPFIISDQFKMHILSQSKINLTFMENKVPLKINVGMELLCEKIKDQRYVDVNEICCPFPNVYNSCVEDSEKEFD